MYKFPDMVLKLSFLSLFTDMSSEMIFPLLPVFLTSLPGGGPFVLGLIEGIAESTASFLKLVSGVLSDRFKRRTPFVIAGYGMAGLVRPLIAFATVWPVVLMLRFFDRVGKGLRSSPRDALIADAVPSERRGSAYGLQRIMDHTGAIAGPLIAYLLMGALGFSIRQVFLFAAVPTVIVLLIISTLKEPSIKPAPIEVTRTEDQDVMLRDYYLLLAAVFVFTLGNSSDAFLLMRLSNVGIGTQYIALLWAIHHIFKIAGAWIGGQFSDRINRKILMLTGLGLYALIYTAFGTFSSGFMLIGTFIIYGVSIGILEPTERAWVSELTRADKRGSAFGFYHGAKGFGALPASVIFGFLWHQFGGMAAFLTGAACAVVAMGIVIFIKKS